MICYFIQHSGNDFKIYQQIKWLLKVLQDEENQFIISLDSPLYLVEKIQKKLIDENLNNVNIFKSIPVTWGAFTQVEFILNGINFALQNIKNWEYFINLSGSCFPLQKQNFLKDMLFRYQLDNIVNFINVFKVRKYPYFELDNYSKSDEYLTIKNFPNQNIILKVHPQLADMFTTVGESPICKAYYRSRVFCHEIVGEKTLYVRPLTKLEILGREQYFKYFPYTLGRAWFIFHKSLCEWVFSEKVNLFEHIAFHSHLFCPDESFFQTLIMTEFPHREQISLNNLRFNQGSPMIITDSHLELIKTSETFFARKINHNNSKQIKAFLRKKFFS